MGSKDKARRETKKPKKDKKAKAVPTTTPRPVIPQSPHATDQHT